MRFSIRDITNNIVNDIEQLCHKPDGLLVINLISMNMIGIAVAIVIVVIVTGIAGLCSLF